MSQEPAFARRPPFRADHVGSLLRPKALREGHRAHVAKQIDDTRFAQIQADCIRGIVRQQEAMGLQVVTDGEFRRTSYWGRFVERTDGLAIRPATFMFRDEAGAEAAFTAPYAADRIKRNQPLALDEFEFLKSIATVTPKITLPAPSTLHFFRFDDFADVRVYPDPRAFFADVSQLFRTEIDALVAAGCRYIQLDEVAVAMLCDPDIRAAVSALGQDPQALIELYIGAINDCIANVPADVAIGVHLCRGNFRGRYLSAGGYEAIADVFFNETRVTHFLLEYDTERAGDFAPLRFVPRGKGAVLGLISSKAAELEDLDDLTRRVSEAERHISLDQLGISPQCGFASTAHGNALDEDAQTGKLALVVRAAREIWKDG